MRKKLLMAAGLAVLFFALFTMAGAQAKPAKQTFFGEGEVGRAKCLAALSSGNYFRYDPSRNRLGWDIPAGQEKVNVGQDVCADMRTVRGRQWVIPSLRDYLFLENSEEVVSFLYCRNRVWEIAKNEDKEPVPVPVKATPPPTPPPTASPTSVPTLPPAFASCTINLNVYSIKAGGKVTASWSSQNAVTAELLGKAVPPSGSQVFEKIAVSTAFAMIVANSAGATAACSVSVQVEESEGFSLCEVHHGFWGRFADISVGVLAGAGSGRLTQGSWGWGSVIGGGVGGTVSVFAGPCWGAGAGALAGLTGFIWRGDSGKNPMSGTRGPRITSNQVFQGSFVPATSNVPSSGPLPPFVMSVTSNSTGATASGGIGGGSSSGGGGSGSGGGTRP